MSSNFLTQGIQGVGDAVNGSLDAMAQAQNQLAKAEATMQAMENTKEQLKKMRRESDVKVLNGYVETAGQIRI